MTNTAGRLLAVSLVSLIGLAMLATGSGFVGTVAAAGNTAPDCSTVSYTGSGNSSDPYEVGNVDQLQCIENQGLGNHYELTSDIDASGTSQWNGQSSFTETRRGVLSPPKTIQLQYAPIDASTVTVTEQRNNDDVSFNIVDAQAGTIKVTETTFNDIDIAYETQSPVPIGFDPIGESNYQNAFTGTFDGNGYTISKLYISRNSDYVGLFGRVGSGSGDGRVEAVSVENADIIGSEYMGGLVGLNFGTVTTSYVSGSFSGDDFVGGLIGEDRGGTVSKSYVNVTVSGNEYVGGLVGESGGTVTDSYANGSISGDFFVGGLLGYNDDGSVSTSYATGTVSGSGDVGGLVGYSNSGTTTNSYWDTESSGEDSSDGGTGLTTSQIRGSSATSNMGGFDFTNIWETVENSEGDTTGDGYPILQSVDRQAQLEAQNVNAYAGGDGTAPNPYEIANWHHLDNVRQNPDKEFVLTADLDSNTAGYSSVVSDPSDGFDPIGDSGAPFTGTFDGDDYTITNLTIARGSENYVGLFGYVDGGTVQNVGVERVDITGDVEVGGLVGQSNGTVTGSHATGDVSGSDDVGGLVGDNDAIVKKSYATGDVSGSDDVGGLIGINDDGTVIGSYATGGVSGSSDDVGGLVGENDDAGSIIKSYATGDVSGSNADDVGGLVGENEDSSVKKSYATGDVSGSDDVGGLIGENDVGTVTASYWNKKTTNQANAIGDTDGTNSNLQGLTTSEMSGINATVEMHRLDFDSTWRPGDGDGKYPNLAWDSEFSDNAEAVDSLVVGDGSTGTPYQIKTVYDLQAIRERVGNGDHFELQNNIDASDTSAWFGGNGFDPIGDLGGLFTGTFDGDNHTISGLYVDRGSNYVGLFGVVSGGTVENVGVKNVEINGSNYVGGLAGKSNAAVTKSHATGDVNGSEYVGGLVGENLDDVTESYATGNVNATRNVGGLVGENEGNVTESYATGDVKGDEDYGGGLAGLNYGNVTKSYATGDVDGDTVGGLVGFNNGGSDSFGYVDNAYASGDVSGSDDVGGLVGFNPGGTVEDAYWDVNTTGQSSSAGSPDSNGLSTTEMQRFAPQVTMDGFSFESPETWLLTGSYPALAWEPVTELTVDTVEATSPTVDEDESGTITVTTEENGSDAGEGVTIEVVNNDSLDGFATGDTAVTDTNGQVTFTFDEPTDGSYSPEFAWADDTSVSDTATVTVQGASENDGGSGGSSGSTDTDGDRSTVDDASVGTKTVVSGTQSDNGSISFTIDASGDNGPITLDLNATDANETDGKDESGGNDDSEGEDESTVSVESLSITPTESGSREFDISVRVWDTTTDTNERATESDPQRTTDGDRAHTDPRTFLIETNLSPLGYVEVIHTNPDSDIDSVTFRFQILKDALNESDVDPSGVTLYRNGTDGWTRLPTDEIGENSTYYIFEGTSPGLSLFTIASAQPAFEVIRANSRSNTLTASEAVTVNATVRNLGRAAGTYTAELQANGRIVATKDVDLASNSSRTISLSFAPSDPGKYTLTVATVSAGAVSVRSNGTRAESTSTDQTLTESTPAEQETTHQTTAAKDNASQTGSANKIMQAVTDATGPGFGVLVLIGAFLIVIVFLRRRS